jgi:hypothetical protein
VLFLVERKEPPHLRLHAHHLEEARGDLRRPAPDRRLPGLGKAAGPASVVCGRAGEGGVLVAYVDEVARRLGHERLVRARRPDLHEPVRIAVRQRLQEHPVEDREGRRVYADAKRERGQREHGEPRAPGEMAEGALHGGFGLRAQSGAPRGGGRVRPAQGGRASGLAGAVAMRTPKRALDSPKRKPEIGPLSR